ncbi:hypothetical protein [Treponema pedis]|uniref:hypothetical protein n=1 Tax=Treponema pedis TaxID=409322 RepID=UPI0004666C35|nr:hypothetical protein [Treponema pedis]
MSDGWNKLTDNVGKVRDKIQSDLDTLKNNIGNACNNATDTMKNGLGQSADNVGNDLNQVKNSWHNLWSKEEYKNKLNQETSVKPKVEPAYFKQGQFDDVIADGKPLFTKAATFTKTLVGSSKTATIQYYNDANDNGNDIFAYVNNGVGYLNALSEHFNIGTEEGKKWYHDYKKDRLSGYQPNAGEHLIYHNDYHFSNNTDSGSQIYEVWNEELINFTESEQNFFLIGRSKEKTSKVYQTRVFFFG